MTGATGPRETDADAFVATLAEAWHGDYVNEGMNRAHRVAEALAEPAAVAAMAAGWTLDVSESTRPRIVREDAAGAEGSADDWEDACALAGVPVPTGIRVRNTLVDAADAPALRAAGVVVTELCGLLVASRLVPADARG